MIIPIDVVVGIYLSRRMMVNMQLLRIESAMHGGYQNMIYNLVDSTWVIHVFAISSKHISVKTTTREVDFKGQSIERVRPAWAGLF